MDEVDLSPRSASAGKEDVRLLWAAAEALASRAINGVRDSSQIDQITVLTGAELRSLVSDQDLNDLEIALHRVRRIIEEHPAHLLGDEDRDWLGGLGCMGSSS